MSSPGPQHAAGGSSFARSAGAAAGRGILLILFAVVIGVVLLGQGYGDDGESAATDPTSPTDDSSQTDNSGVDLGDTTDSSTVDGSTPSSTPTSSAAARPPGEVTVLVANASRTNGVAGANTDELNRVGYTVLQPTNAIDASGANTQFDATNVYFVEGYQAEATAVAESLQIPATQVAAMPPEVPVADIGTAQVLVVIGLDGAGIRPS
ncbi:MAG: LytR C-terminal domain-containing protein [Actinomycetota bacterium]|nr:LytR C-terminal domain-containing protein [Actinomycetota bacterium]